MEKKTNSCVHEQKATVHFLIRDLEKRRYLRSMKRKIARKLHEHLFSIGFQKDDKGRIVAPKGDKETVRRCHWAQRREKHKKEESFIRENLPQLLKYFASGNEVVPTKIHPEIILVNSGSEEALLFRLAALTWSIPVSEGYGRRMRFIVWDKYNGKLLGLIAIGDPVFNLNARDDKIGWSAADRRDRLVNIMDAYVLGALPPYNMLLGGKLIASLVRTQEIKNHFSSRYKFSRGLISGKKKYPDLLLVTTTSALGKSSIYNRLIVNGVKYFEPVGYTMGYGHFHVPDDIFNDMREYLKAAHHHYYNDNRYGGGPNWKFRAIRATLDSIGMDRDILFHGIRREVYICKMARNAYEILQGSSGPACYDDLLSVNDVSRLAIERWVVPRSLRNQEFRAWGKENIEKLIYS